MGRPLLLLALGFVFVSDQSVGHGYRVNEACARVSVAGRQLTNRFRPCSESSLGEFKDPIQAWIYANFEASESRDALGPDAWDTL
jgi:hypothetical protein